jgi:hypothetical protein
VANGPTATLTLGAGSSVNASGGGGGNFGVQVNGGKIILTESAFVNMPGGGGSSQVQVSGGGAFNPLSTESQPLFQITPLPKPEPQTSK